MLSVSLPVELWLHIFRLSTLSPLTDQLRATTYSPFEIPSLSAHLSAADDADVRKTKFTLALVCKQWRALSMDLLYEDLWMGCPHKLPQLSLCVSPDQNNTVDYPGCWVRRVTLPYSGSTTPTPQSLETTKIIEQCPRLEVLVRNAPTYRVHEDLRFEFPIDCPPLPSLKRLDWWHVNDAARTGGINCLADVLQAAPNLRYLSLGGYMHFTQLCRAPVTLPYLTTLRIVRSNMLFIQQTCYWTLPAVKHLILDTLEDVGALEMFWETFGKQIRTVELGRSLCYYVYDALSGILPGCPNLEELSYYLQFTAIPPPFRKDTTFLSITAVRLHAHQNSLLVPDSPEYWKRIEDHFAMLSSPAFPSLRKVILHGDWSAITDDIRYPFLVRPLLDRRCIIECA